MNNFELIANVDINIASPIISSSAYENILIVGPLPAKAPAIAPAKYGEYNTIEQVEAAGWVVSGPDADPVGIAARVAFAQASVPGKLFISAIQDGETSVDAVKRAASGEWYVVCPAGIAEEDYAGIAEYIETKEKVFCYTELAALTDAENPVATVPGELYRTIGVYGRENSAQEDASVPAENKYINVAFAVAWLAHRPGSETAAFKVLNLVKPSSLTREQMSVLATLNLNYFLTVGAKNVTMNGKVSAGEWADVIRFRDWLKNDMQERVANLYTANPKIPYTDAGISLIQNEMLASLKNAQTIGGIAPDEYDEAGNLVVGFKTSVPRASSVPANVRESRILPGCKFSARLAGAIHVVNIAGSLSYTI